MRLQDVENRVYILISKAKLCPSIYGMLYSYISCVLLLNILSIFVYFV